MNLVQITFHFEFWEKIEAILDEGHIDHFIRFPAVQGKDAEGKHYGSQIFPGSISVVQALVEDENVNTLLESLKNFREERQAHRHIEAVVLNIARKL